MALSVASLVSYWRLDETTGSRSDGYGSNTLTANGTTSYTTGKRGNAVSLNGTTGNYLSVASNSGLQTGNQDFCVSLWVNFQATGTKVFMAKAGGAGGNEFSLAIDVSDNKIWFVYWNSGPQIVKSPSTITTNTWYHVVAWCDTGTNTINLCVDNGTVQSATRTSNTSSGTAPLAIGGYSDGTYPINGYVDEVALWKAVPTSGDIAYLYGSGSPPSYLALVAYDADTQAFLTATSISDTQISDSLDVFVSQLKSASLWSKLIACYPFVGGSATTHKYNLKDPRDLDAAYRLTFGGTWTHNANGVTGDGSTSYADTHCDLHAATTINSLAIGVYNRTSSTSSQKAWGTYFLNYDSETGVTHPGVQTHLYVSIPTVVFLSDMGDLGGTANRLYIANTNNTGLMMSNRPSSSVHSIYRNGVKLATNTPSGGGLKTGSYLAFGACYKINGPTWEACDVRNYGVAFVSTGLSDSDVSYLWNAVETLQINLGRSVISGNKLPPQQRRNLVPLRRSYNW